MKADAVCKNCGDMRVRGNPNGFPEECAVCGPTKFPTSYGYMEWFYLQQDKNQNAPLNAEGQRMTARDLTDDESDLYRHWQRSHPEASPNRLLKWIEGRRYDPSTEYPQRAESPEGSPKWA